MLVIVTRGCLCAMLVVMSDNTTNISITGKVTYNDDISIAQAAQVIAFLNADEAQVSSSTFAMVAPVQEQIPHVSAAHNRKVVNPRDALDTSGASTNPEKIVALGAYVLQDGGETFKVEDVKSQFRRARETSPSNFTRDLGVAIASGWIFEADDAPGEYYLNSKIDPIFDGDFVFPKGVSKKTTNKSVRSKVIKPEELENIEEFHSILQGYLPYSKMKSQRDRLLWVVNYMREVHDRKGVLNKEISWISDHIGTGIPTKNVTAAFTSAKTNGYAIRSQMDNSIKITEEGIEYLKSLTAEV